MAGALTGNSLSVLLDAYADIRAPGGKEREQILAQIQEALIKQQPVTPTLQTIGQQQTQPAAQGPDWKEFFAQNHDLNALMTMDPENPNPVLIPEWKELDNIEITANKALDQANTAQELADNDISVDPAHFCRNASLSLNTINQCHVPDLPIDDSTKVALLQSTNEPTPGFLQPSNPAKQFGLNA